MSMYATAELIARMAHKGRVDRSGRPYFDHVERVVDAVGDDETLRTVAVLHDTLEDTTVMESDLRALFPSEVVNAVLALTRRTGESYVDYIARVNGNALARLVKIADATDNMRRCRQSVELFSKLKERYIYALRRLGAN